MWLNQIQNPNQTRGNMKRYYTKLLDPNEFFLYCTFHTQFLRLLLLKKVAACSKYTRTLLWKNTTEIIVWESVVQTAYAIATAPCSQASFRGLVIPYV